MNSKLGTLVNDSNNIYSKLMIYSLNEAPTGNSNLWEGNARKKFYDEYPKQVAEMEKVASSLFYLEKAVNSCDEFNSLYEDYLVQKEGYDQIVRDYNAAKRSGDYSSSSVLASLVNSAKAKLDAMAEQLRIKKQEIRDFLSNVK